MYTCFKRKWWKDNSSWPNGLEPDSNGRKTRLATVDNEKEARAFCRQWNEQHVAGRYSVKCEYTEGGI